MSTDSTELKVLRKPIEFGNQGAQIKTLEDAYRFAEAICKSGLAPKGMEKPEAVMIALQMGAELGLPPMAALQNIGVINGRPGIYGDAALALVRGTDLLEEYAQKEIGERGKETWGYEVRVKRKGQEPMVETFTMADAKTAGLWGKSGPWTQYPKRMFMFRARGFLLRDAFGDVLKGLRTMEELGDIPPDIKNVTHSSVIPGALAEGGLSAAVDGPAALPEGAERQSIDLQGSAQPEAERVELKAENPQPKKISAKVPHAKSDERVFTPEERKLIVGRLEDHIISGSLNAEDLKKKAIANGDFPADFEGDFFDAGTKYLNNVATVLGL